MWFDEPWIGAHGLVFVSYFHINLRSMKKKYQNKSENASRNFSGKKIFQVLHIFDMWEEKNYDYGLITSCSS